QHHSGGEYRIDEAVRIADHYVILSMAVIASVGVVSCRLDLRNQGCAAQTLGKRRALRNGGHEEFAHRGAASLHVVRPYHRADTGCAVRERDEPKPAVIEPVNRD